MVLATPPQPPSMDQIASGNTREASQPGGADAAAAVDAQRFDATKNKDLNFWQHSATLHDIEADLVGCAADEKFKEAVLRDYDSWIVSSALLATVGFGSLYAMNTTVADHLFQDGKRDWTVQVRIPTKTQRWVCVKICTP